MTARHIEIETARLLLCRPRLSDAGELFRFLGDKDAMRFTTALGSEKACRRHVAAHERRRRRIGAAPWAIVEAASDRLVGYGGLYDDPFDPGWGLEVGYFFARSAWGRGYATELAETSLALARRQARERVVAFAHPENLGSQRVLEKVGFGFERFVPGMNRRLYGWRPSDTLL